jgi:ABC-type Fe3+-hydroxamate transport system substrate-binding protein
MANSTQKRDKFIELAKSRVNRAINMIRLISNLANKSHYDYTSEQAKKIIKALNDEVKSVEAKFASKKRGTEEFTL